MRKKVNLEWYAFYFNWNKHKLERYNILGESFAEEIYTRIKSKRKFWNIHDYSSLKEQVTLILKSHYWSRSEYEVIVRDFGTFREGDPEFKIDVWYQIEKNIDRICEYIIREMRLEELIYGNKM